MTAERAHAGTEWQAALPLMEALGGFQMQLLPLTCTFIAAPGYPSWTPVIYQCQFDAVQLTEAPGKGQAAKASRGIKGEKTAALGAEGLGSGSPSCSHLNF